MNFKAVFFILFCCYCIVAKSNLYAQIKLTHPLTRAVYQRNQSNEATLYIAGSYAQKTTKIEARAIARPMTPSQGTSTAWTTIKTNPSGGLFYGSLIVKGGWYNIQVRAWRDTTLVGKDSIERVGVGEVFVIAGQSNACGVEDIRLQGNYGPQANDDRVSFVNYINWWDVGYYDIMLPMPVFQHADSTSRIAPFGISAWCWGAFGDLLTNRLNVPVAFFNAARSSTAIETWSSTANDPGYSPPYFIYLPPGMPYGNLRLALNFYAAQFGVRAVLWHQGESDNITSTSREDYAIRLNNVIKKSRLHSNKPNLTWVVSRATRFKGLGIPYSRSWQPVLDAQNDVIGLHGVHRLGYTPNVLPGPETDAYIGPHLRDNDDVHFKGQGHYLLARLWNEALNDDFFRNVQPYPALALPEVTTKCSSANTLIYSTPANFVQSLWTSNNEATNYLAGDSNYMVSSGSYRVRLKDVYGNTLITARHTVPSTFEGMFPAKSNQTGTWNQSSTWSCGRIPSVFDDVTISKGHTVSIPSNTSASYASLQLEGSLIFATASILKD